MGYDRVVKAIGVSDVCLDIDNGNILLLRDMKHIPHIHMNLISTGKLDNKGFCNIFRDSKWNLTKGSLIVARR